MKKTALIYLMALAFSFLGLALLLNIKDVELAGKIFHSQLSGALFFCSSILMQLGLGGMRQLANIVRMTASINWVAGSAILVVLTSSIIGESIRLGAEVSPYIFMGIIMFNIYAVYKLTYFFPKKVA
ncbi:hypothetical protein D3C87_378690 [compost metagenome]